MFEKSRIEQLEKTIEEQKIAISQISHEVRNPVTLINSSLQLVEKEHPEVRTFSFWKETMMDMKYLVQLLNEVSNYNNGETLHLENISATKWLREIGTTAGGLMTDHHRLSCEIPENLPILKADPIKLRQAITNLLRNAFESLDTTGEVSFNASVEGFYLILRISDTGCGIAAEYIPNLFDPFVTHKTNGTGLGLAITKRVILSHEGTLEVHSKLGEGTVFVIGLPI